MINPALLQNAVTPTVTGWILLRALNHGFDCVAGVVVFTGWSGRQPGPAHWTLDRLRKPGLQLLAVVLTLSGTSASHFKLSSPVGLQPTFSTDFKWGKRSLLPMKTEPPNTSVSPCLKQGGEYFEING